MIALRCVSALQLIFAELILFLSSFFFCYHRWVLTRFIVVATICLKEVKQSNSRMRVMQAGRWRCPIRRGMVGSVGCRQQHPSWRGFWFYVGGAGKGQAVAREGLFMILGWIKSERHTGWQGMREEGPQRMWNESDWICWIISASDSTSTLSVSVYYRGKVVKFASTPKDWSVWRRLVCSIYGSAVGDYYGSWNWRRVWMCRLIAIQRNWCTRRG